MDAASLDMTPKKKSTEYVRAFRERQRANRPPKRAPKSASERCREYRRRKKALLNASACVGDVQQSTASQGLHRASVPISSQRSIEMNSNSDVPYSNFVAHERASDGWYRRWMSRWKKADGDFCDDNCQENVMDVEITDDEKLIALVSERRSLWDMSDTNYHTTDIQQKLWNEIAEEMNSDVENMQDKWRGLQETFRQEFEKSKQLVYTKGTASPGVIHSTWPYFKYMLFMADFFQPEIPLNNLPSPGKSASDKGSGTDYELHQSQNNIITPESVLEVTIHEPSTSSDIIGVTNGGTKSERTIDDEFLEIEKAKLKLFTDNGRLKEDSEYQFLISLLPYLKRVPQHRKLLVRNRLQQVFIEEEERQRQAATNRSCQANLAPLGYTSSTHVPLNRSDQDTVSTPLESPTSSNSDSQGHRHENDRYIITNIKTENKRSVRR